MDIADIVTGELTRHAEFNGWSDEALTLGLDYLSALRADPNATWPPELGSNKANVVKTYMDQYALVS